MQPEPTDSVRAPAARRVLRLPAVGPLLGLVLLCVSAHCSTASSPPPTTR
jgi:hypothetical protein